MKTVTILLLSFVFVSCRQGPVANLPYKSCKEFCSSPQSNALASTVVDIRCHRIKIKTSIEVKKKGYCYDGPLLKGIDKEAIDPDPEQCKALWNQAQKKCDALTPDPSMMNQSVSGTTLYKGDKVVMKDGKPVINGKVCTCDKEQTTSEKESKASPGKTTTEKPAPKTITQ